MRIADFLPPYRIATAKLLEAFAKEKDTCTSSLHENKIVARSAPFVVDVLANGARYVGELRGTSEWNGFGILMQPDGSKYEGEFKCGRRHGKGMQTYPSGKRIEGAFFGDQLPTSGVITWPDGERYEGPMKNGRPHGPGVITMLPENHVFRGNFKNGKVMPGGVATLAAGSTSPGPAPDAPGSL